MRKMRKNILTIFLLMNASLAAIAAESVGPIPEDTERTYSQVKAGGKDYEWKSHTTCSIKSTGIDPVYPGLGLVTYYVCPDKTISHSQPKSTGFNSWEGYCGQTAISNITSMICQRHMDPRGNDFYGTDPTPGAHSSTMKKSLRKIFTEYRQYNNCPNVTWNVRQNWTSSSFLKSVKGDLFGSTKKIKRFRSAKTFVNVTPTPVLLNSGGLRYHWVTVVDIIPNSTDSFGCDVVVNTWGDQKTLTCANFVSYADHTGFSERISLGFD
jgi:hypothetical protein